MWREKSGLLACLPVSSGCSWQAEHLMLCILPEAGVCHVQTHVSMCPYPLPSDVCRNLIGLVGKPHTQGYDIRCGLYFRLLVFPFV